MLTSPNKNKIRPIHLIVCDDIRTESNGKLIIIGVYSTEVQIERTPPEAPPEAIPVFQYSLCLAFKADAAEDIALELLIEGPVPENKMHIKAAISVIGRTNEEDVSYFNVNGLSSIVTTAGKMVFSYRQNENEPWTFIRDISVKHKP